mmetsp:Transcript_51224/g.89386  ORF Transcript_51224/g.89386 Transcript_51224/m.89386 type:complete len:254 (-) Transcript_51224:1904-2665(-)
MNEIFLAGLNAVHPFGLVGDLKRHQQFVKQIHHFLQCTNKIAFKEAIVQTDFLKVLGFLTPCVHRRNERGVQSLRRGGALAVGKHRKRLVHLRKQSRGHLHRCLTGSLYVSWQVIWDRGGLGRVVFALLFVLLGADEETQPGTQQGRFVLEVVRKAQHHRTGEHNLVTLRDATSKQPILREVQGVCFRGEKHKARTHQKLNCKRHLLLDFRIGRGEDLLLHQCHGLSKHTLFLGQVSVLGLLGLFLLAKLGDL